MVWLLRSGEQAGFDFVLAWDRCWPHRSARLAAASIRIPKSLDTACAWAAKQSALLYWHSREQRSQHGVTSVECSCCRRLSAADLYCLAISQHSREDCARHMVLRRPREWPSFSTAVAC